MARTIAFGLAVLFGMTLSTASGAIGVDGVSSDLATQRNVRGVITAVESASVTIQAGGAKNCVTGRVDPKKTRIFIGNVPAKVGDLQLSSVAVGELMLDETWETIRVSR